MAKFGEKILENIYNAFTHNTSKMLIITGTLGWGLSSAAQIIAILANNKISDEKKSFLIPQEMLDAVINVGAFFGITMLTKKCAAKLVDTGKILPKSTREFLNTQFKDKIGNLNFSASEALKNAPQKTFDTFDKYKNFVTTAATVGASIASCNLITPLVRNYAASDIQKNYINIKNYQNNNYSGNLKI